LMIRFYDLWRKENLNPATSLHQAQRWLRDATNGQILDQFEETFYVSRQENKLTNVTGWLYSNLDPDTRVFAHPFYWAAFQYIGI